MPAYSDLEITLRKRGEGAYTASFRYTSPGDDAEQSPDSDEAVAIDTLALTRKRGDAYAAALTSAFFTEKVKSAFQQSLAASKDQLRVRISIEPSAAELHPLHWEALNDPRQPGTPLFMGENVVCSRFLTSSLDWKPIRLRPKANLRALVVAANPASLGQYEDESGSLLAPVDSLRELEAARSALQGIEVTQLSADFDPEKPATLNEITDRLRSGFDILYLVCHGVLLNNEPLLHLEEASPVEGTQFVQRIKELNERPRLVVLASCQSAGVVGAALSALGPRLAEAGVPAVIAMQGKVSMEMIARFMPRFFSELLKDGQIDRAISVARGEVRDSKQDYWMPALFLRLRDGRIWYEPGFKGGNDEFEQWESICKWVRKGKCVPILGPDVCEHLLGTSRELAAELAGESFPLDVRDRFDLAKVSQYLLTSQNSAQFARDKVREALESRILKSASQILGKPAGNPMTACDKLADALATSTEDPLRIAAALDAKVFLNASCNDLLGAFLRHTPASNGKTKEPKEIKINWRDERRDDQKEPEPVFEPSVDQPLLYHVFGKVPEDEDDEDSVNTWVLTEDDFFDYLIKTSRFNLMPQVVSDALVTGSLLFLGFPLDDWKFRVLFRLILAKGGSRLLTRYNHVAVQVDPAETTLANARRAKKYMEKYFGPSNINIYWGSAADFLRDLDRQLRRALAGASHGLTSLKSLRRTSTVQTR